MSVEKPVMIKRKVNRIAVMQKQLEDYSTDLVCCIHYDPLCRTHYAYLGQDRVGGLEDFTPLTKDFVQGTEGDGEEHFVFVFENKTVGTTYTLHLYLTDEFECDTHITVDYSPKYHDCTTCRVQPLGEHLRLYTGIKLDESTWDALDAPEDMLCTSCSDWTKEKVEGSFKRQLVRPNYGYGKIVVDLKQDGTTDDELFEWSTEYVQRFNGANEDWEGFYNQNEGGYLTFHFQMCYKQPKTDV